MSQETPKFTRRKLLSAAGAGLAAGIAGSVAGGILPFGGQRAPEVATASPTPSRTPELTPTPTPQPTPTETPSPEPTKTPEPTKRPIVAKSYNYQGIPYTGLEIKPGTVVNSPFKGRVEIGKFYFGPNGFTRGDGRGSYPTYAYVLIWLDNVNLMNYDLGIIGQDVKIIAVDGQTNKGSPLFQIIGDGPSYWTRLYDKKVSYQVVAGLILGGQHKDPTYLFNEN